MSGWVEHRVFIATSPARFQSPEDVDGAFAGAVDVMQFSNDRRPYLERPYDMGAFLSLVPAALDQMRLFLAFLNRCLADDRPFIAGREPSLADFAAYPSVWRLLEPPSRADQLADFPRVMAWAERVASFGHGSPEATTPEAALEVARTGDVGIADVSAADDPAGRKIGDRVTVRPDDTGRDTIMSGELFSASEDEVAILSRDADVGEVAVHFPRLGFEILADVDT